MNKNKNRFVRFASAGLLLGLLSQSCTDEIKFGDSFIEKAPSGEATMDDIIANAEYARNWAQGIYALQYYGLPYNSGKGLGSANMYRGKLDAVTDCYQMHWSATAIWNDYYLGALNANRTPLIGFTDEGLWEAVRRGQQFLAFADDVKDMDPALRTRLKGEVRCIIANKYFDLMMIYGGLPIIREAFSGSETSFDVKRGTIAETVDYIVELLDQAITELPWAYNGTTSEDDETNNRARWCKAGAMALKAKVLTFAASPLFNSSTPYYGGSEAENQKLVWYGDYQQSRWQRALQATQEFFDALDANGFYALEQAQGKTSEAYRLAYRKGYLTQTSHEWIISTRVRDYDNWANGYYNWSNWVNIGRNSYCPTWEYMCLFPWKDGAKFDWEKDANKIMGSVSKLTGKFTPGRLFYQVSATGAQTASRDPRLYENMVVNGMYTSLDMTTAATSGDVYELWVGGYHEGYNVCNINEEIVEQQTTKYPTGFGVMKYQCGEEYKRLPLQWVVLGLSEMHLIYAECLAQTGDLTNAINQVDIVRKRVGMNKSLGSVYPEVKTSIPAFIEQLLRERACELGMSNARYHDMVRYKRADWMTKELHGIITWRLQQDPSTGEFVHNNTPWFGDQKNNGIPQPSIFTYDLFTLQQPSEGRALWKYNSTYQLGENNEVIDDAPKDVTKWFLMPLPQSEIIKGYGLIQNPGWDSAN